MADELFSNCSRCDAGCTPLPGQLPYGCTEQTLNRFIPTAVVHQTLVDLGFSLEDIRQKRVNLNAQELGDPSERAQRWKQKHIIAYDVNGDPIFDDTPVFSEALVQDMIQAGINRLNNMQNSDGGWGWFLDMENVHTLTQLQLSLMA